MNKKVIYFKGFYGYKNLGDDIFCVTADWLTNNLWQDKRAIIIGDNLPILSKKSLIINTKNRSLRKVLEILISLYVDNIIYFGGSVFHSKSNKFLDIKRIYSYPKFANKISTIGTSIGPFKSQEDYNFICGFLNGFKFLTLRDESSIQIAKEMKLKNSIFSFDIAILTDDVYPGLKVSKEFNSEKIRIGVSLCHYERYVGGSILIEKERENAVLEFLIKFVESNKNIDEIVFFVFNGNSKNGDIEITSDFNDIISRKISTRIVNYSSNTESILKEIKECDAFFGMRLHSGILAYALDVPFMLVEYHTKCTEFLNTINHNFRFIESSIESNYEKFNTIIDQRRVPGIKNKNKFKDTFYNAIKEMKNLLN